MVPPLRRGDGRNMSRPYGLTCAYSGEPWPPAPRGDGGVASLWTPATHGDVASAWQAADRQRVGVYNGERLPNNDRRED